MLKNDVGALWMAVVLAGVLLWIGCDNTLDPFAEETGQFSIYGYLSVLEREHLLRIKDLNDPLVEDSMRVLDATVTLENLATGATETLDDSIVAFEGVSTHNFQSTQQIQSEVEYRLTVERPSGHSSQVTATMPELTEVEVAPGGPVACTEPIEYQFRNIPEPRLLRVSIGGDLTGGRVRWTVLEDPSIGPDGTITYRISPSSIVQSFLPQPALDSVGPPDEYCIYIDDKKVRMAYTHFGPDWPADSVLTDPFESAVENGVGVFGGLHRDTLVKNVDTGN